MLDSLNYANICAIKCSMSTPSAEHTLAHKVNIAVVDDINTLDSFRMVKFNFG